jgi:hypothetical protein
MLVTPATGAFTGSFLHADGKRRTIRGAFVHDPAGGSIIEGFFRGVTSAGMVKLTVPPSASTSSQSGSE